MHVLIVRNRNLQYNQLEGTIPSAYFRLKTDLRRVLFVNSPFLILADGLTFHRNLSGNKLHGNLTYDNCNKLSKAFGYCRIDGNQICYSGSQPLAHYSCCYLLNKCGPPKPQPPQPEPGPSPHPHPKPPLRRNVTIVIDTCFDSEYSIPTKPKPPPHNTTTTTTTTTKTKTKTKTTTATSTTTQTQNSTSTTSTQTQTNSSSSTTASSSTTSPSPSPTSEGGGGLGAGGIAGIVVGACLGAAAAAGGTLAAVKHRQRMQPRTSVPGEDHVLDQQANPLYTPNTPMVSQANPTYSGMP